METRQRPAVLQHQPRLHSRRGVLRVTVGVGGAVTGLPLLGACRSSTTTTQQDPEAPTRPKRIGYLGRDRYTLVTEPFLTALRALGYVEGETITIDYRLWGDQNDQAPALAAELVRLPVDLIVAQDDRAIRAAKAATTRIPIIMGLSADPVGAGFVRSLARPGANITGMRGNLPALAGKRLDLLTQVLPNARQLALIWDPEDADGAADVQETRAAAQAQRIELLAI
jgi:ABC transporter substrate binding protein